MIEIFQTNKIRKNESGSIAIMAAFTLMMAILITGIVYDFGLWFVTRAELQNVADLAAMAGGRALGATYAGGQVDNGTQIVPITRKTLFLQYDGFLAADTTVIQNAVINIATQNQITIETTDIQIGVWNTATKSFSDTPAPVRPNAVRVTANGQLNALFGRLANLTSYNLSATATAALTPIQYVPPANQPALGLPPGQLVLPLGIDAAAMANMCTNPCTAPVAGFAFPTCFNFAAATPALPPNTAWTTFNQPATQANFNNIVNGVIPLPDATAGDFGDNGTSFSFGGPGGAQTAGLTTLFLNAGLPLGQPWEILVPIYQNNTGIPPAGQQFPIVGFASAKLLAIQGAGAGAQNAFLKFQCNAFSTGRSGDLNDPNLFDFGTRGSVPVLVQ